MTRSAMFWTLPDDRDSPASATFGKMVSSVKKTRMDVLSSDLYIDHQSSDDSLPDLATAFGVKPRDKRLKPPASSARTIEPSAAETLTRNTRPEHDNNSDSLMRIRQIMATYNSPFTPPQRNPSAAAGAENCPPSRNRFDFDPISSSSPASMARPPTTRAKSFNATDAVLSNSPLTTNPPLRAPIHRANTFPSAAPVNPPRIYHEISDEEDEDLKAAIAVSLADMDTQPLPVPMHLSSFQDPIELWNSSPPEPATQIVRPTIPISTRMSIPPASQTPVLVSEPPSSQTSSRVRDDTRRLLNVLDDLTTNHLKRKNEETPPPPKKTTIPTTKKPINENMEQRKPKRGRLTQEQKVLPIPHKH